MGLGIDDWLDDPNEYACPECGGTDTRIGGYAGLSVGIKCSDHECDGWFQESRTLRVEYNDDHELEHMVPPEEWVTNGEPEPVVYQCPACGSYEIERTPYDDGGGRFDVKLECEQCGASTWE